MDLWAYGVKLETTGLIRMRSKNYWEKNEVLSFYTFYFYAGNFQFDTAKAIKLESTYKME